MAGDLSHFLLPNSRLPKDVSFLVSGMEVAAHKSLLASQHQIFDKMFFEDEAVSAMTSVKVQKGFFNWSSQLSVPKTLPKAQRTRGLC